MQIVLHNRTYLCVCVCVCQSERILKSARMMCGVLGMWENELRPIISHDDMFVTESTSLHRADTSHLLSLSSES